MSSVVQFAKASSLSDAIMSQERRSVLDVRVAACPHIRERALAAITFSRHHFVVFVLCLNSCRGIRDPHVTACDNTCDYCGCVAVGVLGR